MNEKQAHTPGPWEASTEGCYGPYIHSCDHKHPEYGLPAHDVGIERHEIAKTFGSNSIANARLIAAAPDLLEACEEAEKLLTAVANKFGTATGPNGCETTKTRQMLVSAITKAKGGTS